MNVLYLTVLYKKLSLLQNLSSVSLFYQKKNPFYSASYNNANRDPQSHVVITLLTINLM